MPTRPAHLLHQISFVYLDKEGAGGNYIYDTRESFFINHLRQQRLHSTGNIIYCNWKERWPEYKHIWNELTSPKILNLSHSRRES